MTLTASQPKLSASQAWREIAQLRISLTCALDGRIWVASVEQVKSKRPFTKANMAIISATGLTPLAAVEALIEELDGAPKETALFEERPW